MDPSNRIHAPILGLALVALAVAPSCAVGNLTESLFHGDRRIVFERPPEAASSSPHHPPMLLILVDGVGRSLLYEMLEKDEMPGLAALLGGSGVEFPHAYFVPDLITTLPSSTVPAWTTALTGVPPAEHGVSGNEFFVRETKRFVAPVPVSISALDPVLACFNDGYLNKQCARPTVYQQMRARDPDVRIWVAGHPLYAGADLLLLKDRKVLADAFEGFLEDHLVEAGDDAEEADRRRIYAELDDETVEALTDEILAADPVADVMTLYVSGTDQFGHVAGAGPGSAIRAYLREVVDPLFREVRNALAERDALSERFVCVLADHGHTEVLRDDAHALGMKEDGDPAALVRRAGYVPRPFEYEVDEDEPFDVVLAYQGAISYVYVADRSAHGRHGADWTRIPRFEKDVLPLAEAFFRNDRDGDLVPELRGTLDAVFVRRPRALYDDDAPFEAYMGGGATMAVDEWLRARDDARYVEFVARLRDLAAGPFGERAGDILLLAHNGDQDAPPGRYYFASTYRSWHGSPSPGDSEIPFIVAHPRLTTEELISRVRPILGERPRIQQVTPVLLELRYPRERG